MVQLKITPQPQPVIKVSNGVDMQYIQKTVGDDVVATITDLFQTYITPLEECSDKDIYDMFPTDSDNTQYDKGIIPPEGNQEGNNGDEDKSVEAGGEKPEDIIPD